MTKILTVKAGTVRETTTGVERGLDVDVTVTLTGGRVIEGKVTLLPAADGRPRYESWGDPDHWVDGRLLRDLRDAFPATGPHDALFEIESAASYRCGCP